MSGGFGADGGGAEAFGAVGAAVGIGAGVLGGFAADGTCSAVVGGAAGVNGAVAAGAA